MLLTSSCLLVVAQFPASLGSQRARFLLGLLASFVLGLGCCLALGTPVPAFVAILAVMATLPRVRRHRPSLLGLGLAVLYVAKRIATFVMYEDQLKLYEVRVLLVERGRMLLCLRV